MGLGWSEVDRDRAMRKIEKAGRPHSSNFEERIAWKYLLCQLLFWLAFEWIGKALKRCRLYAWKFQEGKVKSPATCPEGCGQFQIVCHARNKPATGIKTNALRAVWHRTEAGNESFKATYTRHNSSCDGKTSQKLALVWPMAANSVTKSIAGRRGIRDSSDLRNIPRKRTSSSAGASRTTAINEFSGTKGGARYFVGSERKSNRIAAVNKPRGSPTRSIHLGRHLESDRIDPR
jgi:hypothetical protein